MRTVMYSIDHQVSDHEDGSSQSSGMSVSSDNSGSDGVEEEEEWEEFEVGEEDRLEGEMSDEVAVEEKRK